MKCLKCHHENTVGAEHCEKCAAPLVRVCVNCGCEISSWAKFCSQCGQPLQPSAERNQFASPKSYTPQHLADKILTTRAALEGERKQITVLFADIKGSMELLADYDAETAQKLFFDPVLERMMQAVHCYEGTVHRVMGDGIMALFGAPLAVEDHAVRACYAGLRMQETVTRYAEELQRSCGVQLTIRVGVDSGEIVVVAIGNDLRLDFTVVGQTAHLANRMEQMAEAGSVLTTANTVHLAEGYITVRPFGPGAVKGLAYPMQTYEVTGAGAARTRLQAAAGRGLTRFVGRDDEVEQLLQAQTSANNDRGQVVAIVGEAGVGKSRFMHEFLQSQCTADWLILEFSSASYGRAMPYLPIIELLRRYFKINNDDNTQSIREKVLDRILALDPALQDALPPLLDLLDALTDDHPFRSLNPTQHRVLTYQAVTRLLLRESRVQPVVAVIEDLHWTDALTLGLVHELVVATQEARLLLVISYRPDYRDEWTNRENYHQLRLNPLASESLGELLVVLLGSDPSLLTLKSFLIERASGNPFFVEEFVRALVDTGVLEGTRGNYYLAKPFPSIKVPPTVQAVLAARIDALPADDKRLLEEAAVIGHDVSFPLLQAICGLTEDRLRTLLDNLQAAEFLHATQIFPDLQYNFKHALTHEVTYSGVLHDRRRDIHTRVVDAIEQLFADRIGEQVERLAYHAMHGERREKALHYLKQAGGRAAARSALSDARILFEQALGILNALPETKDWLEQAFEVRIELRSVLRQLGEVRQGLEHLREAESLAQRLKDDRRLGHVYAFMTTVQSSLDELDEALVAGTRAVEIARRLEDPILRSLATSCIVEAHYYLGEYGHVANIAAEGLAALPAGLGHEFFGLALPPSVFGRSWLIMSLAELGRFAAAAKYEAEAIQIAESTQHAHTIGWAQLAASILQLTRGSWVEARSRVTRWNAILRTGHVAMHLPWAVAASAWILAQSGEVSEALDRIQEAEQLLERQAARGIVGHRGWAYGAVGRACLLLGRLDEARRLGDHAVESSQRQPGFAAHALRLLGDIVTHPDRFDAETGLAHYQQALALARVNGMRPLVAHCHHGLSKLYSHIGEIERAHENLVAATTMYRHLEMVEAI